ncbi:MAG: hypothetical protein A2X43_02485 [Candidatus Margulisbacteria bacterium GWD2_39_127]|nr:MAG: hypothetical protein A2X43_02485 [Candidatus Margulisbacteria bacterium GWD2_39_127]
MEENTDKKYYAHTMPDKGPEEWQFLEDHLQNVARMAGEFASEFESREWACLAGLWHDLGKYSSAFQEYIGKCGIQLDEDEDTAIIGNKKSDHTSAGAIWAKERLFDQGFSKGLQHILSYVIAGHHAGLHNWHNEIGISGNLQSRLEKIELLEDIRSKINKTINIAIILKPPCGKALTDEAIHLWMRMIFSCLVDADRLDTEKFMNLDLFSQRKQYLTLNALNVLFDQHMNELKNNAKDTFVNRIRANILKQCMQKGIGTPGFFSITVPTGGGKTLSSMAWALEHARKHNKKRIVFAIPYTSIITQTAQIYRDIFGEENVVEHHSNIDEDTRSQASKLASENWDAPIIITTNVQLFESLFAAKTSRCRKLHNLANSIIILDEVQMLPPDFLKPIISALKTLVEYFKVSVLFSSATQPALVGAIGAQRSEFIGLESVSEIIDNPTVLSEQLKRVYVNMPELHADAPSWRSIADELNQYEQVLCILNTRKDCRELYKLMPEDTEHLSRLMCSQHILDSIDKIKQKLKKGEPVRVVSTQLIEAGVDIDFPVVYRSLAGLDSIAQSAGRCNREGKLNESDQLGQVKIFKSPNGVPVGFIRKGVDTTKELLSKKYQDYLTPEIFKEYFHLFYSKVNKFDKAEIDELLVRNAQEMKFQFATAAKEFCLIDDKDSRSFIVHYKDSSNLIEQLKRKGPENWLLRKLQRYTLSVKKSDFDRLKDQQRIIPYDGIWVQSDINLYNQKIGLKFDDEWLDELLLG